MGKTDMNVMTGTKVPALRFKGFNDEWVEMELKNIVERVTRKNINNQSKLPLTISAEHGLIAQSEYFDRRIASKDISGYYLLANGDFAYNKSYSNGYPFGVVKRLDRYDDGVVSTLYIVFSPKNIHSDFLVSYYDTELWHREISKRATEGARNHGLLNIGVNDFFNSELSIPLVFDEQQQIGQTFKTVDALIQSEQDKLEQLIALKKSFLQKMFPKKGATVPELRFDGFSGDWAEMKLGDVLTERNVQHEPTDEYPLVSFTVENGVTPKTDRYNREFLVRTSDKKYKATEYNDIVYNPANLKFGAIALNTYGKAVFSPIYVTFTVDDGYDPYYMGLYVTTADFINYALKYQEGTVYERMAVKSNDFLTLDVGLPSIEEQFAIGQFFKIFDELIAKQEEKVENGKLLKKALLQKMFV